VRVDNPPLRVQVSGAVAGGAVSGELAIGATTSEHVDRVALYVDGKLVSRDGSAPYRLLWNTKLASEGEHTLLVYARGRRRAALTVPVVVANASTFPDALSRNWVAPHVGTSAFGVTDPDH
jgi:hypothetical protein